MFSSTTLLARTAGALSFLAVGVLALNVSAAEGPTGHTHGHTSVIGESAKAMASTRTVEVNLVDIAFEPQSIRVKAGETVRFVLINSGQLLHEFNLGTAAMHAEHQKEMAVMAEHGMISATAIDHKMMQMDHSNMPGMSMKHDDPNSVLLEPGERKELVWRFAQPMDLEFACNVPGHYEAGMVGKIEFNR